MDGERELSTGINGEEEAMNIALVLGTRPEIIKMAPIIWQLEQKKISYILIHSNQHYSPQMDAIFFKELHLPEPTYHLRIGSADHGNQTGQMLIKIEDILLKETPSVVLAQGDTNTVLAGILAAAKQNIPTGHVEAGLRSYDRRMPEEKNRVICDVLSDYLFAPTSLQEQILQHEGIPKERIFVVGNTIVDAVYQYRIVAERSSRILSSLHLTEKNYVLVTAHRALNVDARADLERLVTLLERIPKITGMPVIYPLHPRTKAQMETYHLSFTHVTAIDPVGYLDFLSLEMHAALIVTDSGGIQEEACILQVPCITIRENTERPETVKVGANMLVGLDVQRFIKAVAYHRNHASSWENPFGDGKTAERILEVLASQKSLL